MRIRPILAFLILLVASSLSAQPVLSSITPTVGSGGQLLTLGGSGFGLSGAKVTIGTVPCPVMKMGSTRIDCTIPAGTGTNLPVTVTTPSGTSAALPFSYGPTPMITSLTPTSGLSAGGYKLTVTGSNFGAAGAKVTIGSNVCTVSSQTATSILCMVPAGTAGTSPVVVNVSGALSNKIPFTYTDLKPR